jgi:tellurite resistance protein TerC
MPAITQITYWHWAGFIAGVLLFLALDLGIFHRHARVVRFKEALLWTGFWACLALGFALLLKVLRGREEALEFLAGYLIELSLSMDNVFVIALVFAYFGIPSQLQHRVLFWGILGALVMRGLMIALGVALVSLLHWFLYVFGALVLATGCRMLFTEPHVDPEKNRILRLARRLYPVSTELNGQKFVTRLDGRRALTPLALVLLMVETTDLMFAIDSIPAIFAVTTKPFIIFTSNVFAVLGLRSLYFVLAGALGYFRYLKYGLAVVLVFIGLKMLLSPHGPEPYWFQVAIPIGASLAFVASILLLSILVSVLAASREKGPPRSALTP